MLFKHSISLVFAFFILFTVNAQETWSLQKCIQFAQQNSLTVKQRQNQVDQAQLSLEESKNNRYPTLNSSIGGNINFGRTIDPVTNAFTSQSTITNSVGVGAGVTLYNGGRIKNQIKQSEIDLDAARADSEQAKNDLALNVAQAYLQILLDEEQLVNTKNQLAQTEAQLKQTDRLIEAGTLPRADRLEILANVARNEQTIVNQQNNLEISYLNLKNLLQINPSEAIKVEKIDVPNVPSTNPESFSLEDVYNTALTNQPFIQADNHRLNSANMGEAIAKSLALPSVSLSGNINSYYSDKALDFTNVVTPGREVLSAPQPVVINGTDSQLQTFGFEGTEFGKRKYFDQINDNFGQSLGVNVNIPIYNRNQTKIAKERAKLNYLNTQITAQQNKQQLKVDIQRAIASARANKKQYEAATKTVESLEAAYANTEKRYKLGAINTFEYTTSKNNLDLAKIDQLIAKYNYLYSLKVVEFYQGKKLDLKF